MMCWLRKAVLFIGTTMAPATLSVLEAYAGTFAAREQSATGQSMAFAAKAHQTWAECHVLGPRSGDVNERRLDRDACHWGVLQFDDRHIARDLASACGACPMSHRADPTSMLTYFGVDQLAPICLQPRECSLLIGARHRRREWRPACVRRVPWPKRCSQPHGPNRLSALGAHSNGKCDGSHSLSVRYLLGFAFGAADAFARIASNFAGRWLQSS